MKRTAYFLAPLLLAFVVFYVWHTPLRGPLTDAEIDAFLANQIQTGGTGWTDANAFEAFLRNDDGRPFVMINLMEVREVAEYPEGHLADAATTGAEAEALYGQAVLPLLLKRGSYPVARATRYNTIINSVGQSAGDFDSFAMVRYRSRRDLIDMLSSDAFLAANIHKWASLENTLVAPANSMFSFKIIGFTPWIILLCIGAVLAHGLSHRAQDLR